MDIKQVLEENDLYRFIQNIEENQKRDQIISRCKTTQYEKGDSFYFTPNSGELARIFLSGKVHVVVYIEDIADHTITWNNDTWFGIADALSEDIRECEVVFQEKTEVLEFPLKEILYSNPEKNIELWIRISKMAARLALRVQRRSVEKGALSTEAYFLLSLSKNGYCYKDLSIKDIAYDLNLNIRTLQRSINFLERDGYLKRDKLNKIICASDKEKVDLFLESIIKE